MNHVLPSALFRQVWWDGIVRRSASSLFSDYQDDALRSVVATGDEPRSPCSAASVASAQQFEDSAQHTALPGRLLTARVALIGVWRELARGDNFRVL
jgi:hypothetical protein